MTVQSPVRISNSPARAHRRPPASEGEFARFGLSASHMQYIGVGRVDLLKTTAVVIFGGADARDLHRALVERFFSNALTRRAPPDDQLWILFDHRGRVLRVGEEAIAPEKLRKTLEARFPRIHTADMTTGPVFGRDGRLLEDLNHRALVLDCVWLGEGSAAPTN